MSEEIASRQSFTYNLQGRIASVVNETYDETGTLVSRERTSYEYDTRAYRVQFTVETDANLDGNYTLTSRTEFLADHHNHTGYTQTIRETEFDADGNITKQTDYTFGGDEIAQRVVEFDASGAITSDTTHIFGHDGHGSVRVLYDLAGPAATIVQAYAYEAYGQMIAVHNELAQLAGTSEAAALTNLGYSGEQWDARLQMQNLRARPYDVSTGRFIGLDPFGGNMQDPQSLHKYAYVHGDPVMGVDPSGLVTLIGLNAVTANQTRVRQANGRAVGQGGRHAQNAINRAVGKLGERLVRGFHKIGREGRIRIAGRLRKPDGLLRGQRLLSEVKNVARQRYTQQLKDMARWSQQNGYRMELWVRPNTILSSSLKQAAKDGLLRIRFIPFV